MTTAIGVLRQARLLLIGRGTRHALPACLPEGTCRVTFVTDARMAGEPDFAGLRSVVEERGIGVDVISSAPPECPVDDVADAARSIDRRPDVIIAVGGGSVIDFAKVLAVLLAHGGAPQNYYGEFAVPGPTIPVVALPTTAGTGSEATPVAVVSDSTRKLKVGISSPHLVPVAAICDPALTDSAPASLTAACGVDALAHSIESLTAIRREPTPALPTERIFIGKNPLADLYALEGIRAVGRSLRLAVAGEVDGASLHEARDDMMLAALAGGMALSTGGTAAAHALQYPVGALTQTPHGVGVGVLLPYAMAFNRRARSEELAQVAVALGVEDDGDVVSMSHAAITAVRELLDDVGIPRTLADLGVAPDACAWIAEQASTARRLVDNNPRELSVDALATITRAAYEGDLALVNDGRA